jgi:V/A-type H+-transporting ATPase subunit E
MLFAYQSDIVIKIYVIVTERSSYLMELQIKDLVESIKKEGVDTAKAQAEAIIAEATKKAAEIVSKADAQAKLTKETSEREIAALKENALVSAEQAKRDAVLSFKSAIQSEYEKILSANVDKALSGDALASLIKAVLTDEDVSKYTAEVSNVSDGLKALLADEIKKGLEIRPVKNVKAGFRLADKDGSGYFDCSDEVITQMLMPFFKDLSL